MGSYNQVMKRVLDEVGIYFQMYRNQLELRFIMLYYSIFPYKWKSTSQRMRVLPLLNFALKFWPFEYNASCNNASQVPF